MKKVLSIVLTIAMVMSFMPSVVFAADSATYSDISGKKCEAAVEELSELGVVNGYEDGTFRPENNVTRAEMSKLIVAALGLDPTSGTTKFIDMGGSEWAIPYVGYAESLGIVNGYGGGKFGPKDNVTYDQAITMIVRALGYTDACEEMQGTWPANYVQKGNELGVLKDVNKTGADPANRGDIAIMLANVLDRAMVYIDKDGVTQFKTGKDYAIGFDDSSKVTMRGTLTKEAGSGYKTVSAKDVDNATKNIREYLGAAGKVVVNEDGDVISVSDIKTQFMTGDFNADGTTFTCDDVDYTVPSDVLKQLDSKGKAASATTIPVYKNGAVDTPREIGAISELTTKTDVTIACTVSGKKISGIYSAQYWVIDARGQVTKADLAQIDKNHKLLTKKFAETDNGDIDKNAFILAGVDSLDKIAEDNVVYIYTNAAGIAKVEVGTEVVNGTVSQSGKAGDYAIIDGTKYEKADPNGGVDADDIKAGNEVELYLDYNNKIYKASKVSSGNYAVVMKKSDAPAKWNDELSNSEYKMKVLSENGVEYAVVNQKKVEETDLTNIIAGDLIKYSVSEEEYTAVEEIAWNDNNGINTSTKITKKGVLGQTGFKLTDTTLIFAAPSAADGFDWNADNENYSVLKKEDVLEKTITKARYYQKDGNIEVIVIDNGATAESEFGVATDAYDIDGGTGVNYYIDQTETTGGELDGTQPTLGTELYKISQTASGKVKFADPGVEFTPVVGPATEVTAEKVTIGGTSYNLADNVIVYIWDGKKLVADATPNELIDETYTAKNIKLYQTITDQDDDNFGCVTYIIVDNSNAPA